jgi:hypothetical protein
LWDDRRTGGAQGKYDQFPIDDESKRAMQPSDPLADELPYLLDPCGDEPSLYLEYNSLGEIEAIDDNVFGEETIRLCHLKRKRLTRARARKIDRMVGLLRLRRELEWSESAEAKDYVQVMLDDEFAVDAAFASLALAIEDDPARFGVSD